MLFRAVSANELIYPFSEGVDGAKFKEKRVAEIKARLIETFVIARKRAEYAYDTKFIVHKVMDTFLVYGLSLLHAMLSHAGDHEATDAVNHARINEWRKSLHEKIPPKMEMLSIALHFNSPTPRT